MEGSEVSPQVLYAKHPVARAREFPACLSVGMELKKLKSKYLGFRDLSAKFS